MVLNYFHTHHRVGSFYWWSVSVARCVLIIMVIIALVSGICRRVAIAAMSLLRESRDSATKSSPQQFSLQMVNDSFLAISASHPTLMVQWCNILILLNHGDQAWWSQLLQTPHHVQLSSAVSSSYVFLLYQTVSSVLKH